MNRQLRVCTYNVLSSSLCTPSYFAAVSDERYCSSKYRLEGLFSKLRTELSSNSIVCLQEVSLNWGGNLHTFFEENDYTFVFSHYGNRNNGYMGVGVAYPRKEYSLVETEIVPVADSKVGGWATGDRRSARIVVESGLVKKSVDTLALPFRYLWRGFGWMFVNFKKIWKLGEPEKYPRKVETPWDLAKYRTNTMICLRLRHRGLLQEDGMDFIVATYHMPCQFWDPAAMSVHTALCFQKLQMLSEGKFPSILAGDFNFKPISPQYAFVTTGVLPEKVDDPSDEETHGKTAVPEPLYAGDQFAFNLNKGPFKSAYAEVDGKEPPFTNYALVGDMKTTFKETIDYVFFKDGDKFKGKTAKLKAVEVLNLQSVYDKIAKDNIRSLPSETEYSDHIMIAANFELQTTT